MPTLRVGHPYHPGVRSWPETAQLRITPDGVELALFMSRITPEEEQDVRQGKAEFAWVDAEHTAVLGYRFGGPARRWSDAPYHPGRDPQAGLPAGAGEPQRHLAVHVVLVDADTGIVRGLRLTTWPPGFVCRVAETVTRMLASGYRQVAHDGALDAIYTRYRTSDELVAQRADITCTAGQP
ncbi:hypothetical protein [Micromonospora chalcea]|uniref:hypothetical protein n=1 Tax=Micromonospora chalcea TaxID=1874 RepID=UPI003D75BBEF